MRKCCWMLILMSLVSTTKTAVTNQKEIYKDIERFVEENDDNSQVLSSENHKQRKIRSLSRSNYPNDQGYMNVYISESCRDYRPSSPRMIKFPYVRYDRRRLPFYGSWMRVSRSMPIYVETHTKQTMIYSRDESMKLFEYQQIDNSLLLVYIFPALMNYHGNIYSIAELIAYRYATLKSNGALMSLMFNIGYYANSAPYLGRDMPKFNSRTGGYSSVIRSNYRSYFQANCPHEYDEQPDDRQSEDNERYQYSNNKNQYYNVLYHRTRAPLSYEDTNSNTTSNKSRLNCQVAILGAGIAGSHSAYRLSPIYKNNLCIFERENYVGGRTYDIDSNGNPTDAYSTSPIVPMGSARFYDGQPVIKQLADELNVSYYSYSYQTNLIKARGKFYTSYNDMCSNSYVNLNCSDDAQGNNAQDQMWVKLMDEFKNNRTNAYHFADFNAFCRYILGDEATEYLRDSFRFRADFLNTEPYSYMEFTIQDWNLVGTIHYPFYGLSQLSKRMIDKATKAHNARLYVNEQVMKINENTNKYKNYTFSIETTNYLISANQLLIAIPPYYWTDIQGTVANEIKSDQHFRSILPVKTIVIDSYWSVRWWESSALFGPNVDRAWTRQNCISFIEILSQHPQKKEENLTRTVYDDGQCVEVWSALIQRSSQNDLVDEILRGLRSIFIDVYIPAPRKTFTKVWPGAWHFLRSNSRFTNQQIVDWSLKPITKFDKHQITLIGEAYNINRSGWTDGAVKSSLMSLNSQFNLNTPCYANDAANDGTYCSSSFI